MDKNKNKKHFGIVTARDAKGQHKAHHIASNYRNGYCSADDKHAYDMNLRDYYEYLQKKVKRGELSEKSAYMLFENRRKEFELNCSSDDKYLFSLIKRLKKISNKDFAYNPDNLNFKQIARHGWNENPEANEYYDINEDNDYSKDENDPWTTGMDKDNFVDEENFAYDSDKTEWETVIETPQELLGFNPDDFTNDYLTLVHKGSGDNEVIGLGCLKIDDDGNDSIEVYDHYPMFKGKNAFKRACKEFVKEFGPEFHDDFYRYFK